MNNLNVNPCADTADELCARDLYTRQLQLEQESRDMGIQRYRALVAKAKDRQQEDTLPPAQRLLRVCMVPLVDSIKQSRGAAASAPKTHGGSRRSAALMKFLGEFTPEQLAYITARVVLSTISTQPALRWVSLEIGRLLEDEASYRKIKAEAPSLFHVIHKQVKDDTSYRRQRTVMHVATTRAGIQWVQLPISDRVRAGATLVDLMVRATGLVELELRMVGRRKTAQHVVPTASLVSWLEDQHARCELMNPTNMPMVHPPLDWTTPYDGGYLMPSRRSGLIKTSNKAYLEELTNTDLSRVYGAVNALQRVQWQVNKPVLAVLRTVWDEMGGSLGGLPARDPMPLPAKPVDIDTNEVALKEWKREAAKVHGMNANLVSKRIAVAAKLQVAEKFAPESAFYFPWQLDWRGRAYPMVSTLHPQGDDVCRGLLRFSEGKPLGEFGASWLAIHIANLFGVDKVSFEERIAWTQENTDKLLDSAMRPLDGDRFWTTADSPWQALAACYEWMGYKMHGDAYVSHLPIAMDGSCNGLQHFSAMLRDPIGGAAVNLIPSDKPDDIYARVGEVVDAKITADAADGDKQAAQWLGTINRALVKRPVMTLPYGATQVGMRDQLMDHCRKLREDQQFDLLPKDEHGIPLEDTFEACMYLAKVTYDSIGQVVVAARAAMDWLQTAARVAAAMELPIWWTTPMGLPVCQQYKQPITKMVDFKLNSVRYQIETAAEADKIDKKRMAAGISPNFVHSLDAAAMMATIEYAEMNGVAGLAMIHDSYGTHAADCNTMFVALRQAFIEQYTPDVLGRFRDELVQQVGPEAALEIPELPNMGNLELAQVEHSKYFFA